MRCSPWGHKESDMTERLTHTHTHTHTHTLYLSISSHERIPRVIRALLSGKKKEVCQFHVPRLILPTFFQMHQAFYRSLFGLAHTPRCLQHLCRCAIRKSFGRKCFSLVPLLPLPESLQNYLLLEPEGVLH